MLIVNKRQIYYDLTNKGAINFPLNPERQIWQVALDRMLEFFRVKYFYPNISELAQLKNFYDRFEILTLVVEGSVKIEGFSGENREILRF